MRALRVALALAVALAGVPSVPSTMATVQGASYLPPGSVFLHTGASCGPLASPYLASRRVLVRLGDTNVGSVLGDNTIPAVGLARHRHPFTAAAHTHAFTPASHDHSFSGGTHTHTFTGSAHGHSATGGGGPHTHPVAQHTHTAGSHEHAFSTHGTDGFFPAHVHTYDTAAITSIQNRTSSYFAHHRLGSDDLSPTVTGGASTTPSGGASTTTQGGGGGAVSVQGTIAGGTVASASAGGAVGSSTASITAGVVGVRSGSTDSRGATQGSREHIPTYISLRACIVGASPSYMPRGAVFLHTGDSCGPFASPYTQANGRYIRISADGVGSTGGSNTVPAEGIVTHLHSWAVGAHGHSLGVSNHGHAFSGGTHPHTFTGASHGHGATGGGTAHSHTLAAHTHGVGAHSHVFTSVVVFDTITSLHAHTYSEVPGVLGFTRLANLMEYARSPSLTSSGAGSALQGGAPSVQSGGGAGGAVAVSQSATTGTVQNGTTSGSVGSGDAAGSIASGGAVTVTSGTSGSILSATTHHPAHVVLLACVVTAGVSYVPSDALYLHSGDSCGPGDVAYTNGHGRMARAGTSGIGGVSGSDTLPAVRLPSHSHTFSPPAHAHSSSGGSHGHGFTGASHGHSFTGTQHGHTATGGGGAHTHGANSHSHPAVTHTHTSPNSDVDGLMTVSHQHSFVGTGQNVNTTGNDSGVRGRQRTPLSGSTTSATPSVSTGGPTVTGSASGGGAVTVNTAVAGGSIGGGTSAGSVSGASPSGTVGAGGAESGNTGFAGTAQSARAFVPEHVVLRPCRVN